MQKNVNPADIVYHSANNNYKNRLPFRKQGDIIIIIGTTVICQYYHFRKRMTINWTHVFQIYQNKWHFTGLLDILKEKCVWLLRASNLIHRIIDAVYALHNQQKCKNPWICCFEKFTHFMKMMFLLFFNSFRISWYGISFGCICTRSVIFFSDYSISDGMPLVYQLVYLGNPWYTTWYSSQWIASCTHKSSVARCQGSTQRRY